MAKPLVSLRFKKVEEVNHLLLNIQSKALPVSWFITSSEGSVILSGHSSLTNDLINIDSLESGHYYLRAAGEKLHFEIY
ncbi:MAG: hypothetical protein HKO66_07745 [Saprospiraceae bacterium]|nr:hypothetical protein [Bacteroidia bacterium]NNE15970.1 hypothetical protein [Saprospiraceae bacterium]NNL92108.1 hypothetical protein [Saprospiraceae bacterium]